MADSRHFENSFVHISAVNYPISIKFGMQMRISIPKTEMWQKIKILQIQESVRTPY